MTGCSQEEPGAKPTPPKPLDLKDITVKGNTPAAAFTPTSVGTGETPVIHTPNAEPSIPEKKKTEGMPPPAKKEAPETVTKKPTEKAPPPKTEVVGADMYTLQVGAYIIDKNLTEARDAVTALGFTPYVKDVRRTMPMFFVVVEKGTDENKGKEIAAALAAKGFSGEVIPGEGGLRDVSAGKYYFQTDAANAERKIKELGYSPLIERREATVVLKALRLGSYKTADEADKDMKLLKEKGFSPAVLKGNQ